MKIFLLVLLTAIVGRFGPTASAPLGQLSEEFDPLLVKNLLSSDFESGLMVPWSDQSLGKVHWNVESYDSPAEANSPAPLPVTGNKYLRVIRNANLDPGLAILRSAVFTAQPGDHVTFSYWIRSHPRGNSFEVKQLICTILKIFHSSALFIWYCLIYIILFTYLHLFTY